MWECELWQSPPDGLNHKHLSCRCGNVNCGKAYQERYAEYRYVLPMWECELWQSRLLNRGLAAFVLPMWECELWQSSLPALNSAFIVLPMWECELWQSRSLR